MFSSFTPEENKAKKVPFYEDAKEADGWKGQSTTKSVERLQAEITEAVSRLGGVVSGFQRGTFQVENQSRQGFQMHYALRNTDGSFNPGRIDIAALPVKDKWNDTKKDKSLRMSLYMLREALEGLWLLQQLAPGYAALMPWMVVSREGKTLTQAWSESSGFKQLLPPSDSSFTEGEVVKE